MGRSTYCYEVTLKGRFGSRSIKIRERFTTRKAARAYFEQLIRHDNLSGITQNLKNEPDAWDVTHTADFYYAYKDKKHRIRINVRDEFMYPDCNPYDSIWPTYTIDTKQQ